MTIKREAIIRWLKYWREDVEHDTWMKFCCHDEILKELDEMIGVVELGQLEKWQTDKGWLEY